MNIRTSYTKKTKLFKCTKRQQITQTTQLQKMRPSSSLTTIERRLHHQQSSRIHLTEITANEISLNQWHRKSGLEKPSMEYLINENVLELFYSWRCGHAFQFIFKGCKTKLDAFLQLWSFNSWFKTITDINDDLAYVSGWKSHDYFE